MIINALSFQTEAIYQQNITQEQQSKIEEVEYLGYFWVTGYDICIDCCGKTDGITANNTIAEVGYTCAASEDLPFGTRLYIDGIGERVVEDRGGAIEGARIDVLCANHEDCYAITGYYDVWIIVD